MISIIVSIISCHFTSFPAVAEKFLLKPPTRSWLVHIGYISILSPFWMVFQWDDLRMDLRRSDPASIDKAASEFSCVYIGFQVQLVHEVLIMNKYEEKSMDIKWHTYIYIYIEHIMNISINLKDKIDHDHTESCLRKSRTWVCTPNWPNFSGEW